MASPVTCNTLPLDLFKSTGCFRFTYILLSNLQQNSFCIQFIQISNNNLQTFKPDIVDTFFYLINCEKNNKSPNKNLCKLVKFYDITLWSCNRKN